MGLLDLLVAAKPLDASRLDDTLFMGGAPVGRHVREAGFRAVALCAIEYQPLASEFPQLFVIRARIRDVLDPEKSELALAESAAALVESFMRIGQKVLVTCVSGRNRSGLVCALALSRRYAWSGSRAMEHVRQHRRAPDGERALTNPTFEQYLLRTRAGASVLRAAEPTPRTPFGQRWA